MIVAAIIVGSIFAYGLMAGATRELFVRAKCFNTHEADFFAGILWFIFLPAFIGTALVRKIGNL